MKSVYKSGIFSNSGETQVRVSSQLAKHVSKHFSGYLVNNNTMGLTACLLEIDVRNRHVLISNFTFNATLQAVLLAGGIPVVCDVNPDSLELDLQEVQDLISNEKLDIAAVLPTRIFGYVNDFSPLIKFCNQHEIPVVIDSAGAFPTTEHTWNFSTFSKFEVFSFHATKVFGIGEGGLIVGLPLDIESVKKRCNFGISFTDGYSFNEGLNAKADEFTAARASARFPEYIDDVKKRCEFVQVYEDLVANSKKIKSLPKNSKTVFSYFPIIFEDSSQLIRFETMANKYFMTRRYYSPTIKSGYRGTAKIEYASELKISEAISKRVLCLPVYVKFQKNVPLKIKEKIKEILEKI